MPFCPYVWLTSCDINLRFTQVAIDTKMPSVCKTEHEHAQSIIAYACANHFVFFLPLLTSQTLPVNPGFIKANCLASWLLSKLYGMCTSIVPCRGVAAFWGNSRFNVWSDLWSRDGTQDFIHPCYSLPLSHTSALWNYQIVFFTEPMLSLHAEWCRHEGKVCERLSCFPICVDKQSGS